MHEKNNSYFKRILFALLIGTGCWLGTGTASAEVAVFRVPRHDQVYSGTNINKGSCYPMTLTENISAKTTGNTGAGCSFNVDTFATGEWVDAGGYYDTPPYAWGNDHYYDTKSGEFTYTCQLPAYTLDQSALPSYISLSGQQDIPGSTDIAPGKRYSFSVAPGAPPDSSFTMKFAWAANCTMKKRGGSYEGLMTSVNPLETDPEECGRSTVSQTNPRKASLNYTVRIGTSCISPTPTISLTPSVTPTLTVTPTVTPTPTIGCNSPCTNSNQCPIECPICSNNGRCQPPPPTPTLTPPPVCGGPCIAGTDTCPIDCPVCALGSGGSTICQKPSPTPTATPTTTLTPTSTPTATPTSTPTPTRVPCNGPCTDPTQCSLECAQCTPGTGGGSVCKAICGAPCTDSSQCPQDCNTCAPSATGTNTVCRQAASCNCDGIDFTGDVSPGGSLTTTAYAKVENPDTNDAKVLTMVYHVERNGQEVAVSDEIAVSGAQRTTDSNGTPIDRYSSSWNYAIPAEGSGETEYRIYAKVYCGYKSIAQAGRMTIARVNPPRGRSQRAILGTAVTPTTQPLSLMCRLTGIGCPQSLAPTPASTPLSSRKYIFEAQDSATWFQPTGPVPQRSVESLKLDTFDPYVTPSPAPRVEKSCKEVKLFMTY